MNKIIHVDNLEVMSDLPLVDLIYSDILYGTGRTFKTKGETDYKDIKSNWSTIKNFYSPRFKLMSQILNETGSIYIQCDYRISHYIRLMLDDYFIFQNEIIWHYNSSPRKKNGFGNRHDTIYRYTKSNKFTFNEDSVRVPYSMSAPRGYAKERYYNDKGKVMGDVWKINMLAQNDKTERVGYSTQKPLELMDIIVKSSSNEGDLTLDPFCGSGTFCLSSKNLGRDYIGIDSSERAIVKCKERGLNVSV